MHPPVVSSESETDDDMSHEYNWQEEWACVLSEFAVLCKFYPNNVCMCMWKRCECH